MMGIVVVAHEHIGEAMLAAVEHVLGPQALVAALSIGADADIQSDLSEDSERLHTLVQRCDAGDGVLLFADMFGGTPCNLALSCIEEGKVEVVSGFNLPMLIKAATLRQTLTNLHLLARQARDAGRHHMHLASELMEKKQSGG
ncbi:MAG: PTS sugar transporter subunit IIA [Mariprofundaceae bacterium]|nr:PTS sugar transporter subunit IIA [Mariprofundaceae bacterium]